jgi:ApbE superfamily uncharacterized protein (UPF0280 family)
VEYRERFYRKKVRSSGLVTFEVAVKETDLLVSVEKKLENESRDLIFEARHQIESYIQLRPEFLTTLHPYPADSFAPPLVREMVECTTPVGVGPMAAVAGAVAQYVGEGLLRLSGQVIVENGGDIFLKANRAVTVSIFAADSPLSERVGVLIPPEKMPRGVCSSSGSVGHSFSAGTADAACVVAASATLADGAATALCNMVRGPKDLKKLGGWAANTQGVLGAVVILGDKLASWGEIELVVL